MSSPKHVVRGPPTRNGISRLRERGQNLETHPPKRAAQAAPGAAGVSDRLEMTRRYANLVMADLQAVQGSG